jgi:hypothetical protein
MSKTQSGLILIGVAIAVNLVMRLLVGAIDNSQSVGFVGLMAVVMIASLVIGLFGLFRLISGLLSKK